MENLPPIDFAQTSAAVVIVAGAVLAIRQQLNTQTKEIVKAVRLMMRKSQLDHKSIAAKLGHIEVRLGRLEGGISGGVNKAPEVVKIVPAQSVASIPDAPHPS